MSCWRKTNSTKTSGSVIAARNELDRKIQFELTVLESLVRFFNRYDKYESECRTSRSNKRNFRKTNHFLLPESLSTTLLVVRNFLTWQKTRIRLPSTENYHKNTSIHKLNIGHKIIQIFLSTILCQFYGIKTISKQ